jgi:vancomycin permeability regulator SanA
MFVFYVIAAILVVLLALVAVVNRAVVWEASRSEIYDCNKEINIDKKYDCILVLGAGVRADGTPSHMLEDRLRGAVALYEAGVSDVLLLSGDNSGEDYDEVSAMVRYCLEHGVPENAIVRDDIGFSTSESVYNTVRTLGYRDILVVTQEYHLYRAMYMVKRMGADADGFATDYRAYSMQIKRDVREYVARCKDFLKVNISLHK